MVGFPAARLTDLHVCPMVTVLVPHIGGPIVGPGAPTVLIGMLPATALFQDNGHAAVWVVDKATSQAKLVRVEVGEYLEDRVAVLSGLSAGDMVVRAGVHKLFAGEKVRAHEEPVKEAVK